VFIAVDAFMSLSCSSLIDTLNGGNEEAEMESIREGLIYASSQ
jgi:hypothetical protein